MIYHFMVYKNPLPVWAGYAGKPNSREITVFEGNDGGFFLTETQKNEPVYVLNSFISMEELDLFLNEKRRESQNLNYLIGENEEFFTYYLLNHAVNYSNPRSPNRHLLIKEVDSIEHFYLLFNCYVSLYKKREEYEQIVNNKSSREFIINEFIEMLTEKELNLFKFSIFCNSGDLYLCDSMQKSFLHVATDIKVDAFESFGISDYRIDEIFKARKMHPNYFSWRIRENVGNPSVFYFDNGDVRSYLKPEDELILWRSGKVFCDYLNNNYDYICDINEPDDRG